MRAWLAIVLAATAAACSSVTPLERGIAHVRRGDDVAARAAFDEAIRTAPRSALAYTHRGAVRARLGDVEGSVQDFTKALELGNTDVRYDRGMALIAKGEYDAAIADLTVAVSVNTRHAQALFARGTARSLAGDLEGARADWLRAIDLESDPGRQAQMRAELATIAPAPSAAAPAPEPAARAPESTPALTPSTPATASPAPEPAPGPAEPTMTQMPALPSTAVAAPPSPKPVEPVTTQAPPLPSPSVAAPQASEPAPERSAPSRPPASASVAAPPSPEPAARPESSTPQAVAPSEPATAAPRAVEPTAKPDEPSTPQAPPAPATSVAASSTSEPAPPAATSPAPSTPMPSIASVPPSTPVAPPPLDARALAARGLDKELKGDRAGAIADLRAALAAETDPQHKQGIRNLLDLLDAPR